MKKFLLILLILTLIPLTALTEAAWILCQPGSYVVCHPSPSKDSETLGYFYCGDEIDVIGDVKGWVKIACGFELGEGYVYKGYVTYDEPTEVNESRVITKDKVRARRYIGGPRRRWLNTGDSITVYWVSASWSVTSQGYVQTDLTGDYDP